MTFKMPKPVYQILLGAFMLAFVTVACDNKKGDKEKEPAKDSVIAPPTIDTVKAGDSVIDKPVDPGTTPKPPGGE